jgi:hypothetical protein
MLQEAYTNALYAQQRYLIFDNLIFRAVRDTCMYCTTAHRESRHSSVCTVYTRSTFPNLNGVLHRTSSVAYQPTIYPSRRIANSRSVQDELSALLNPNAMIDLSTLSVAASASNRHHQRVPTSKRQSASHGHTTNTPSELDSGSGFDSACDKDWYYTRRNPRRLHV